MPATAPSRLVVAALVALALGPAAGAQPRSPPATVPASALGELINVARRLPRGGQLRVEGLRLGPAGPLVTLALERVQVYSDDAEIVVHRAAGERRMEPPDHAWLHGRLAGEPGSVVLLTVPESGPPRGLIMRRGSVFLIRAEGPDVARGRGRLVALPGSPPEESSFDCRLDDLSPPEALVSTRPRDVFPIDDSLAEPGPARITAAAASGATHTARVAVETDWELFQRFGSASAVAGYVGDLFAYLSTLYSDEVVTTLEVSHLSLWDSSSDPWTQTSPSCGLFEFGRYWNDNRGSIDRTIAHFLSGKSTTAGIAWLGVLCGDGFVHDHRGNCPALSPQRDDYGGAYGFTSGISGSFDPSSPSVVWDVFGVAHEIGHNFDSPHTHCYGGLGGSSLPVDECSASQCDGTGCFCGTASLPCPTAGAGCGTVMSYCHLFSRGLDNITFTFGEGHPWGVEPQRVPQRMRSHVLARAELDPACLALTSDDGTCENLELSDMTITTAESFAACGTLFAGPAFRVESTGDVTLTGGRVVLRNGFSVAAGGRLTVAIAP